MRITASVVALLALAGAAHAGTVQLSEFFVNPPGTDNGQEFFELCGDAGESLSGLKLIIIEGDGTGAGSIDAIRGSVRFASASGAKRNPRGIVSRDGSPRRRQKRRQFAPP